MFRPKSEERKSEESDALNKVAEKVMSLEKVLKQFVETTDRRLKAVERAASQAPPSAPTGTPILASAQPPVIAPRQPIPAAVPLKQEEKTASPSISEGVVQKFVTGIENVTKATEKLTQISTALEGYIKDLVDTQAANIEALTKVNERLEAVGKALTGLSKGRISAVVKGEEGKSPIEKTIDKLHKDLERQVAEAVEAKSKGIVKEVLEKYKSSAS